MIIVSKNVVVLKAGAYKTLYNVSDEDEGSKENKAVIMFIWLHPYEPYSFILGCQRQGKVTTM